MPTKDSRVREAKRGRFVKNEEEITNPDGTIRDSFIRPDDYKQRQPKVPVVEDEGNGEKPMQPLAQEVDRKGLPVRDFDAEGNG